MNVIPENMVGAFVGGEILQVLFVAVLAGIALAGLGRRGRGTTLALEHASRVLFKMIGMVMLLAPIGAFGAMAYTVGHFGLDSLGNLAKLMLGFYLTALFRDASSAASELHADGELWLHIAIGLAVCFVPGLPLYARLTRSVTAMRGRDEWLTAGALLLFALAAGRIAGAGFSPFLYFRF